MNNLINIAYDRTNLLFVAYNVKTGIFTTGVSVEIACEAYRKKYSKPRKTKTVFIDTSGSMND
jgi:hypothetical protein